MEDLNLPFYAQGMKAEMQCMTNVSAATNMFFKILATVLYMSFCSSKEMHVKSYAITS